MNIINSPRTYLRVSFNPLRVGRGSWEGDLIHHPLYTCDRFVSIIENA